MLMLVHLARGIVTKMLEFAIGENIIACKVGWKILWENKGRPNYKPSEDENDFSGDFNCVELQLTRADLYDLQDDIVNFNLPEAGGFFWGSDSYFWTDENGINHIPITNTIIKNKI